MNLRGYFFNFVAAVFHKLPERVIKPSPVIDVIEGWICDGCERHTPHDHKYASEPMF